MKAIIEKILPWYPAKVALQWTLENVTEYGTYTYNIERSGSPSGAWEQIASNLTNVYQFEDDMAQSEVNALSLTRDIYYRIEVIPPSGAVNKFYSAPINIDGQTPTVKHTPARGIGYRVTDEDQFEVPPDTPLEQRHISKSQNARSRLLRRKILRDEFVLLKKIVGIKFLLFKRKHFGERCTSCYDSVTREVLHTKCPICYGTSWVGGYYEPIEMYGRRMVSRLKADVSNHTYDATDGTTIQLLDFPRIEVGDLLIEKAHNRRFRVAERYFTTLKTIPIHQSVLVQEIERGSVEYSIPAVL